MSDRKYSTVFVKVKGDAKTHFIIMNFLDSKKSFILHSDHSFKSHQGVTCHKNVCLMPDGANSGGNGAVIQLTKQ